MLIPSDTRGLTLIDTIVGTLLIMLGALLMIYLYDSQFKVMARMDRRAQGDQVLVTTAGALQRMDFDELLLLCDSKSVLDVDEPVAGECQDPPGTLNPALLSPSGAKRSDLEILRDWNGESGHGGMVCIELNMCRRRVGGRLLDVMLTGHWPDPVTNMGIIPKNIMIARTRW